jgi:C1A family cysteine protease
MPYKIHKYGWVHDLPDHRDLLYSAPNATIQALPPAVNLTSQCPPVYDQGQLGSCTANAIAGAIQFTEMKENLAIQGTPSRLFIYYNERAIEGTVSSDSGAQIRDGVKSVASQGACLETLWPYDPAQFAVKPPQNCYTAALQTVVKSYQRLTQSLSQLQGCLASGYPFVFGFTVYESFESQAVASTGVVPMPAAKESSIGGHAVMAVGYDNPSQRFIVRNSWAATWGQAGYFTIPYAYVTSASLASDFWTIRLV